MREGGRSMEMGHLGEWTRGYQANWLPSQNEHSKVTHLTSLASAFIHSRAQARVIN